MITHPSGADESAIRVLEATEEADFAQARRLLREFAAEYAPQVAEIFLVQGFEAEVTGLPGRYAAPLGCLFLVWERGVVVGCVALRDLGGGTCEMKRLYVAEVHRGKGHSRRLVAAVIRRAAEIGYGQMVLDTLLDMKAAIALYRTFGFVDAEPYWDHPAPQAVFMKRPIHLTDRLMGDEFNRADQPTPTH